MRVLPLALLLLGAAPAADPPNVVVILCDDLGLGDLGCYNPESKIPTPAMDRLAAAGMRFRDMHTPSSVCTPTRYGLLTGRYCWRGSLKKGVLWGFSPALIEPGRPTIASVLRARGYRAGAFGKWHLGLGAAEKTDYAKPLDPGPLSAGFDEFEGIPASLDMEPYVWVKGKDVEAQPTDTVPASKHQRQGGAGFWRGGPIAPGLKHADILPRIEKAAVDFLGRQKASTPFFLYVPLTSPHTPWLPSPAWTGKSDVGAYGDFVMETDAVVGRILDALKPFEKDTLVVLTSDNGSHWPMEDVRKWGHRANGPWRGQKADIHEGGHRVPFLARWPGKVAAGSTSDATACLTDLFATAAEIAGDPATAEDSWSLLPALKGEGRTSRPYTVHHSSEGMFAIREGSWKLIQGQGSGGFTQVKVAPGEPPGQLYDLAADPGETKNLYAEKPEVVARLSALLR
ncbi:MAG TPA: arylsulfatase [Planctomycetota bacterium]